MTLSLTSNDWDFKVILGPDFEIGPLSDSTQPWLENGQRKNLLVLGGVVRL